MKLLLVTLVALQLSLLVSAQDTVKKKEAGIVFSSFNNFGATFRAGNSKSMWRYSAFILSGYTDKYASLYQPNIKYNNSSFGTNATFGKEFRRKITEKFQFRYGADILLGYSNVKYEYFNSGNNETTNSTTRSMIYGFNLVVGTNYLLTDNLLLGVELLPSLQYRDGSTKQTSTTGPTNINDNSTLNFGLSTSSVLFSLVYRW